MILENEISVIGHTIKPHGINGEISATVDRDINLDILRCIVLDIDGIYVPFFINSFRSRGSEAVLLTIDGITDEKEAATVCGLDIFALNSDIGDDQHSDDDGLYMADLIGYTLLDEQATLIGEIIDYDDSTANILLTVTDSNGNTKFIPFADELIEGFDPEQKTISVNIPEGILDL